MLAILARHTLPTHGTFGCSPVGGNPTPEDRSQAGRNKTKPAAVTPGCNSACAAQFREGRTRARGNGGRTDPGLCRDDLPPLCSAATAAAENNRPPPRGTAWLQTRPVLLPASSFSAAGPRADSPPRSRPGARGACARFIHIHIRQHGLMTIARFEA